MNDFFNYKKMKKSFQVLIHAFAGFSILLSARMFLLIFVESVFGLTLAVQALIKSVFDFCLVFWIAVGLGKMIWDTAK